MLRVGATTICLILLAPAFATPQQSPSSPDRSNLVESLLSEAHKRLTNDKPSEAFKLLEAADLLVQTGQDRYSARWLRVELLMKVNNRDLANRLLREMLAETPNDPYVLNELGYSLADHGEQLEEAYEMIKRASDLKPNNPAFLDSLGWAAYRLGRLDEAETHLRQAVALNKTDNETKLHLAEVLAVKGDKAGAQALANEVNGQTAAPEAAPASPLAPFLGEWVTETRTIGVPQYQLLGLEETGGDLQMTSPSGSSGRSVQKFLHASKVRQSQGQPSSSNSDGIFSVQSGVLATTFQIRVLDEVWLHRYKYSVPSENRMMLEWKITKGTQTTEGQAFYYRRGAIPPDWTALKMPDTDLQLAVNAALEQLTPLLKPYDNAIKRARPDDVAHFGVFYAIFGMYKPIKTLDDRCNPVSKEVSTDARLRCTAREISAFKKQIEGFLDWRVQHDAVFRNRFRLKQDVASRFDDSELIKAWAELMYGFGETGSTDAARLEQEKAQRIGVDLVTAWEQLVKPGIQITEDVRRASRNTRSSSDGWLGVLRDVSRAVAATQSGGTAGVGTAGQGAAWPSASTSSTSTAAATAPRATAGTCGTLGSMGLNFPRLGNPEVDGTRDDILNENISTAVATAKSQGLSLSAAISQMNQQADQADRAKQVAAECVSSAASDPGPILQMLRTRSYSNLPRSNNMLNSCIASYVMSDLQAAANRASAKAFQSCWY